jgi:hypothetical protein
VLSGLAAPDLLIICFWMLAQRHKNLISAAYQFFKERRHKC